MNLKVDKEFQEKIPPLTEAEFEQLKENILSAGEVYEPIAVWNGVIVDGHNRWKIILEHPEIRYRVKEMQFADRWAAFEWMYKNQLGRRNLTEKQKDYMIGKMYEARKQTIARNEKGQFAPNGQNVRTVDRREQQDGTAGQIGKEVGLDSRTVRRAGKFAQGVDALKAVSPEAAEKVLQGEANVTKAVIQELPSKSEKEIKAVAKAIESGANLKAAHFPSDKKRDKETDIPAPTVNRDPDAVVEYGIDDLLEEMRAVNADFLRKYRTMLSIHAQLVSDNAAEVATVFVELVTEFEKMEDF